MYSYSSESSSIVKATSTGDGYKVYKLVPQAYLTPVANNIYTYARFATTLQILSGDADLYLYVNNPTTYPPHDGSLCGCTNCNIGGNQPSLYETSCRSGTATEIFNTIGPAVANRPGGYVRIIRLGFRPSDSAEVAQREAELQALKEADKISRS
jgi:hypothetical protein